MQSWTRCCVLYGLLTLGILAEPLSAKTRRLQQGAAMPVFTVTDDQGQEVTYTPDKKRATMVVFFSSRQARSRTAFGDLIEILTELGDPCAPLDTFVIVDDPNHFAALFRNNMDFAGRLYMAADPERKLWGQFGVIAMPTAIVAGPDGRVLGVAAGYGYDYAPTLRRDLARALGIAPATTPTQNEQVTTLTNDTVDARVQRLLRTAAMLRKKGRLDSALAEVQKAHALQPEALPIVLKLAELWCFKGQGQQALEVLAPISEGPRRDVAQAQSLRGWAYRQLGQLQQAEDSLKAALKTNPQAIRTYFHLGQVYEDQDKTDLALEMYRKALILQFGDR